MVLFNLFKKQEDKNFIKFKQYTDVIKTSPHLKKKYTEKLFNHKKINSVIKLYDLFIKTHGEITSNDEDFEEYINITSKELLLETRQQRCNLYNGEITENIILCTLVEYDKEISLITRYLIYILKKQYPNITCYNSYYDNIYNK